jgi:hypothetical protein
MKFNLLLLFILVGLQAFTQALTQTLRGTVKDKETQTALAGVMVTLMPINFSKTTDSDGTFTFQDLPIARYSIQFSSVGYENRSMSNVELGSGKEVVLSIELTESITTLQEVVVKSQIAKDRTINDMAMVSGRQFSVQESNRYAGGYADASRMAMSFAGVTSAGNDQNNEIVIRGNSPKGLLWRLEGVEIPNPNHFGDGQGATSGIISMLNSAS